MDSDVRFDDGELVSVVVHIVEFTEIVGVAGVGSAYPLKLEANIPTGRLRIEWALYRKQDPWFRVAWLGWSVNSWPKFELAPDGAKETPPSICAVSAIVLAQLSGAAGAAGAAGVDGVDGVAGVTGVAGAAFCAWAWGMIVAASPDASTQQVALSRRNFLVTKSPFVYAGKPLRFDPKSQLIHIFRIGVVPDGR